MRQICEVSKVLGVTFEGHEQEAMRLFVAIETSRNRKGTELGKRSPRKEQRLARELQKLEWSINYAGKSVDGIGGRGNNKH